MIVVYFKIQILYIMETSLSCTKAPTYSTVKIFPLCRFYQFIVTLVQITGNFKLMDSKNVSVSLPKLK